MVTVNPGAPATVCVWQIRVSSISPNLKLEELHHARVGELYWLVRTWLPHSQGGARPPPRSADIKLSDRYVDRRKRNSGGGEFFRRSRRTESIVLRDTA